MGRQVILRFLRRILFLLLIAFSSQRFFAQTETSQMVLPKRIFVGDTAELHYTFNSNVDFFPNEETLDEKPLIFEKLPFDFDNENFTLQKAVIQKNGLLYTVVLTFTPWKVGILDFPQIDLLSAVFGSTNSVPFLIDPKPIEISSIITKYEDSSLRGIKGPLLFPGTIYAIYAAIVLFVVILIFILHTILKWQEISAKFRQKKTLRMYAKNARNALRQFRKLEKNSLRINDVAFCLAVQQIFRYYLTVRFGRKFDALSTEQISAAFEELTAGTMSDFLRENVSSVQEIFRRADYIRFAHGSLDAKREPAQIYAAELQPDERTTMIANSRTIIKAFETGGENA
jgi:hypothetical protein